MTGGSRALVRPGRILLIANPRAGGRRQKAAGDAAARVIAAAGRPFELRRTDRPGDAQDWAGQAAAGGFDLVIAEGGDGTVNEAANGVAGTGVALGVAPSGTMNLLARMLGLPLQPARAVATILDGYVPLPLQPGAAAGRVFLLMAGAGFDAWVLREILGSARSKIGFGDYVRGALRGLRTFPFPELRVRYDGQALTAHSAIVGRAPLYGGFLRPTPHASLNVDRLELCAFTGGALRLAALAPRLFSGAHGGCDGATLAPARHVELSASIEGIPYQLDGELAGTLPVAIGLSERILVLATRGRMA